MRAATPLVIDCDTCPVRHVRCDECVVTALGPPPAAGLAPDELPLDDAERRAVDVFVRAGLVDAGYAATLTARRQRDPGRRAVG
ncbi:hypothetical protein [Lapillicoccus jejuensis]|uniref:Uncharacterized protein n=1 Tax=Lapillicoccus jejuensis TaxID=402171 RepID=A0A542E5P8_9MICO|nr:hypothetical protein [Lapillicoccus jejuensis]TQJ10647.1 hypothetical protein FB458_3776 [Lapillicoccus jejuensis]